MGRRLGWVLVIVGIIAMVSASFWAPPQPEFLQGGGSCEISLCGYLEDPPRWRAAWWPWGAGAVVAAIGVLLIPRAMARRGFAVMWLAIATVALPVFLIGLTMVGFLVSLWTSVHGAITVYVVGALLPYLALASATVRAFLPGHKAGRLHGEERGQGECRCQHQCLCQGQCRSQGQCRCQGHVEGRDKNGDQSAAEGECRCPVPSLSRDHT